MINNQPSTQYSINVQETRTEANPQNMRASSILFQAQHVSVRHSWLHQHFVQNPVDGCPHQEHEIIQIQRDRVMRCNNCQIYQNPSVFIQGAQQGETNNRQVVCWTNFNVPEGLLQFNECSRYNCQTPNNDHTQKNCFMHCLNTNQSKSFHRKCLVRQQDSCECLENFLAVYQVADITLLYGAKCTDDNCQLKYAGSLNLHTHKKLHGCQ